MGQIFFLSQCCGCGSGSASIWSLGSGSALEIKIWPTCFEVLDVFFWVASPVTWTAFLTDLKCRIQIPIENNFDPQHRQQYFSTKKKNALTLTLKCTAGVIFHNNSYYCFKFKANFTIDYSCLQRVLMTNKRECIILFILDSWIWKIFYERLLMSRKSLLYSCWIWKIFFKLNR
jgi:hypothetical protein